MLRAYHFDISNMGHQYVSGHSLFRKYWCPVKVQGRQAAPRRGIKLTAQGKAERSEAAPWVTQPSGLVAPTGQKQAADRHRKRKSCCVSFCSALSLHCFCPVGATRSNIGITRGVAPFGRLPRAVSCCPFGAQPDGHGGLTC